MSAVAPGYEEGNEDIPSLASSIVREKSPRKTQCLLFWSKSFFQCWGKLFFCTSPWKLCLRSPNKEKLLPVYLPHHMEKEKRIWGRPKENEKNIFWQFSTPTFRAWAKREGGCLKIKIQTFPFPQKKFKNLFLIHPVVVRGQEEGKNRDGVGA